MTSEPALVTLAAPAGPVVYRMSLLWRLGMLAMGVLPLAAGLAGVFYFGSGHDVRSPAEGVVFVGISLAFALLGAYFVAVAVRFRVVLDGDAIELVSLRTQRMRRDEIAGTRNVPNPYFKQLVMLPKEHGAKKLKVPLLFKPDARFEAWCRSVVDLDAAEKKEAEAALTAELGGDEAATRKLARARTLARVLNAAGGAATLWALLSPSPYPLVIGTVAVLPWIALVVVAGSGGLLRFDTRRNQAHPHVAGLFLAPTAALFVRCIVDIQLIDWVPLLTPAVGGAAAATVLMVLADRGLRARPSGAAVLFPFLCALVGATLAQADTLLDHTAPEVHATTVTGKRASHGRVDSYYLVLAQPPGSDSEVTVTRELFDATSEGDTVQVNVHAGALGWRWFYVTR